MVHMFSRFSIICAAALVLTVSPAAQSSNMHATFDHILDTYVRDGYVYYGALQKERASLDRYVASLDVPAARVAGWSRAEQGAFWLNGYNAIVLQTVINGYPTRPRSAEYPAKSIRQIPGAFETIKHRVAGKALTLDEIEREIISTFDDARMLLAMGRGSIGCGRLRSEAFDGSRLEEQLSTVLKETATHVSCVKINRDGTALEVSPLFSWREAAFVKTFASRGEALWPTRSPLERAVAGMVYPYVFASERDVLSANKFRMEFGKFDWRLNDLTGGIPE